MANEKKNPGDNTSCDLNTRLNEHDLNGAYNGMDDYRIDENGLDEMENPQCGAGFGPGTGK